MSSEKLSSDEVPLHFTKWLLTMGCPPDTVPSVEKVAEMCRGQYYMVWRSLMEHVQPKNGIKQKRLQVFCDDVQKWRKKSPFNEQDTNAVMPEELMLWHQQTELRDKVKAAEIKNADTHEKLKQITDKITIKMAQRNLSVRRVQDLQRRVWLLQQVAEELKAKKNNLQETKTIADSLCSFDEEVNVSEKLEKCMTLMCQQGQGNPPVSSCSLLSAANPVACSSVVSTQGDNTDTEEHVSSLVKCRGDSLWRLLCERRAAVAAALASATPHVLPRAPPVGTNPQSVLANTAALHCTLGIETMKNRVHIEQTQKRFVAALADLNNYLSSAEEHELAVVRCERAYVSARAACLAGLLRRLAERQEEFAGASPTPASSAPTDRLLPAVDRAIESKREELKRLLVALATTEKKIFNIKDCLFNIFGGFRKDVQIDENERYKNFLDFPQESTATLRQFYEARREQRRNKLDLSLNLDVSENCSFTLAADNNPTYTDELRIYMKKFNLEKNRKLVFESGEKIWIFETLQSAVSRLHTKWQGCEIACPLVCPSVTLACNLRQLVDAVHTRGILEVTLRGMEGERKLDSAIDISSRTKEEEQTIDKIKKRLNENLLSLQKTIKTLEIGQENLKFWSENRIKEYLSSNRKCNGRIYKDYECFYIEKLGLNIV
ncbi:uncharacterized protein LOC113511227 isoform X2 [Galleria mellonella]|uniref:Uncharacterized protein LOC113511227 isoform X2 n=1 Tax=Galleria mellonella TaxID=7137 RepID=A0A6J3C6I2_GALME|nr:uncharacterized protein LOC113511227 isoform X2 [Galleria mellonella]